MDGQATQVVGLEGPACGGVSTAGLMELAEACAAVDHCGTASVLQDPFAGSINEPSIRRVSCEAGNTSEGSAAHSTLQLKRNDTLNHVAHRKRKRGGRSGPNYRNAPGEPTAMSKAIQMAASTTHEQIFYQAVGTTSNSWEEAKDFYNLYSWEVGFGIRCGKSRSNDKDYVLWADFVCSCEGFDKNPNSASSRTGCKARIRVHRTEDDGWFISTFSSEHNHSLSEGYHEKKQWKSHGDIDPISKGFIRNLRENNVSLSKVCSILNCDASLQSMPTFRKGAVNKSLCAKVSQEKLKDDIGKTTAVLEELKQSDPTMSVALDVDSQGTIKN